MNSASLPAGGESTAANSTIAGAAPAEALVLDPAQLAAAGVPAAMPFLQFMDLNAIVVPSGETATQETGSADAALPDAAPADAALDEQTREAGSDTLLAAMAMPLMPSMMMALPAALPAAVRFGASAAEQGKRPADAAPVAAATAGAAAVELPLAAAVPALPVQADTATAQLARAGAALQPSPAAAASQPAAAAAQPREAAVADAQAAPATSANAGFGVSLPSSPAAAAREGSTLTLAGPPTAWRQSLQEALGERLNVQLTKNAEQAVIRLEPPMLGRVEISIRHIAGSLEVNITATHSEVLRQLNSVSDNLRSDLAGRQYTDVSVNVSQAGPREATPRAQAAAQHGAGTDAQGRGRQQGQDQDERVPGSALADAHQPNTAFSLNARA